MRADIEIDHPPGFHGEWTATIACPNVVENAVVYVSPSSAMAHFNIRILTGKFTMFYRY
jgi:hypothetical protein